MLQVELNEPCKIQCSSNRASQCVGPLAIHAFAAGASVHTETHKHRHISEGPVQESTPVHIAHDAQEGAVTVHKEGVMQVVRATEGPQILGLKPWLQVCLRGA